MNSARRGFIGKTFTTLAASTGVDFLASQATASDEGQAFDDWLGEGIYQDGDGIFPERQSELRARRLCGNNALWRDWGREHTDACAVIPDKYGIVLLLGGSVHADSRAGSKREDYLPECP